MQSCCKHEVGDFRTIDQMIFVNDVNLALVCMMKKELFAGVF